MASVEIALELRPTNYSLPLRDDDNDDDNDDKNNGVNNWIGEKAKKIFSSIYI